MSFDAMSIDAVGSARASQSEAKIAQQAETNVRRAKAAADIRSSYSASSSSAAPAPAPAASHPPAPPKKQQPDAKVMARKAAMISKYLSNPEFAKDLQGIIQPASKSSEADLDFVLEQIRERLNSGMGPAAVKALWIRGLVMAQEPMAGLPPKFAIPYGAHNYAAMRMNELEREFNQLAIEYDHFFGAGPWARLFMKTAGMLYDYKEAVESGQMPMLVASPQGEAAEPPPEEPLDEPEVATVPKLPPPMKVYPEKVERAPSHAEFIEPMPSAPVFSSDPPPVAAPSRGRGKKRGGL